MWHNIQNKNIKDEKKNQEILFYTKKIPKLIGQNDRTGGKHEQVPGKKQEVKSLGDVCTTHERCTLNTKFTVCQFIRFYLIRRYDVDGARLNVARWKGVKTQNELGSNLATHTLRFGDGLSAKEEKKDNEYNVHTTNTNACIMWPVRYVYVCRV